MSIEVSQLSKSYGTFEAVKDISFTVPSGSLFAFLGANGAGKSTTIGCITTTLDPSSGQITVDGFDVARDADAVRTRIGVVFQQPLLDPLLTVQQNLRIRAGFYGMNRAQISSRVQDLATLIDAAPLLGTPYGKLSGGQQRRIDIARALLHQPRVLFLDEPTAGLDPQSRERIWSAMHELRQQHGVTIFLTTHYMEETERADSVCIIDSGRIVAAGTPAELRSRYSSSVLTVRAADTTRTLEEFRALGVTPRLDGDQIIVPVQSSEHALQLLRAVTVADFEFRHGTMNDVFLAVTEQVAA